MLHIATMITANTPPAAAKAASSSGTPSFVIYGIIAFIAFIVLWAGLSYLWNKKWRPRQMKQGIPTASFNSIFGRLLRFIMKEDKYPSPKVAKKSALLAKILVWRNIYAFLFLITIAQFAVGFGKPLITLFAFIIVVAVRARKIFSMRYRITRRMFEVAASEFKYPKGADLNPWAYVNIRSWDSLTVPGVTIVSFPAAFKSEDQRNKENFERHFDGTVTEDNAWLYTWKSSESYVECKPISHIPTMVPYPGSANRPWHEIPLGVGVDGEVTISLQQAPHILICGTTGAGKSVVQRNFVFHCIQHKDMFRFLGIDLKRVELRPYAKYKDVVMGIGTTLEDALEILRYANDEMMRRYEEMEELGYNNFMDLPNPPFALFLMIDEAYQLLAPENVKTDEGKVRDELHGEALTILGSIARLGRAAGVHMLMATQRPDAKILGGELKQNLAVRIAAGRMDSIASGMTLDNDAGTRLPAIKGRGYVQIFGEGQQFQGYFAKQDWIDNWLDQQEGGHPEQQAVNLTKDEPEQKDAVEKEYTKEKKSGLLGKIKAFNESKAKESSTEEESTTEAQEPVNLSKEDDYPGQVSTKDTERTAAQKAMESLNNSVEDDFEEDFGLDETSLHPLEPSVTPKAERNSPEVYDLDDMLPFDAEDLLAEDHDPFGDLDDPFAQSEVSEKDQPKPAMKKPVEKTVVAVTPPVKPATKAQVSTTPAVKTQVPAKPAMPARPTMPTRPARPTRPS